ncbi:hypothetical protein K461DRAFT_312395 [Myriangium duriaei CBS 260.36]|uniref:Peptidase A1 domain-containing protein n=1 Tax=Myriangium duriaei CBS 260.36 TaxID=1168546 RepID=A0A9P4J1B0_9PEZI|nr:hypothetical protein K461DRAFT_312395 [Myriangium duriaei CBS 260.36]
MPPNLLIHSFTLLLGSCIAAPSYHTFDNTMPKRAMDSVTDRVLRPAVHWTVAGDDLNHVHAKDSHALYYADYEKAGVDMEHHFGTTAVKYTVPAVNLDHSEFLNLDKTHNSATIKFNNSASFDVAFQSWHGDKVLLLTYSPICPAYNSHDFCYVLASRLHFDKISLTATADARIVDPTDYVTSVKFEYGLYSPQLAQASVSTIRKRDGAPSPNCQAGNDASKLPIVDLGPDFDKRLDDCRGYKEASVFDWYFYSTLIGANQQAKPVLEPISSMKGHDQLMDFSAAVSTAKSKALSSAAQTSRESNPVTVEKRDGWDWLPGKIPGLNSPISLSFNKETSWSVPQKAAMDASPWGQSWLLKKYTKQKTSKGNGKGSGGVNADGSISIWCVDCGTKGSVTFFGKGSWDAQHGLSEGFVTASLNLNIGFGLGMEIQAVMESHGGKEIGSFGIPGLSFGIITIGPQITIGADYSFQAHAEGRLLVGAKFGLQDANIKLDFVNAKNSGSSGWTPQFVPMFEAAGQLAVAAEIGLPLGLKIGVDIMKGKFTKTVGFEERPALAAQAEFGTSNKIVNTPDCTGISTGLDIKYDLYGQIVDTKYSFMKPFVRTLAHSCIKPSKVSGPIRAGPVDPVITKDAFAGFNTTGVDGKPITFKELVDSTQAYSLTACPDSNVYMQPRSQVLSLTALSCASVFQYRYNMIVGDGNSRMFHYYIDSMNSMGVSRLRIHDNHNIPDGSEFATFVPSNTGNLGGRVGGGKGDTNIYMMVRSSEKQGFLRLYPALCVYQDSAKNPPKLFVIKDPHTGLATLESKAVQNSITGGAVSKCFIAPLTVPGNKISDGNKPIGAQK